MARLSIVVYSDIHHHYWQNGITEDDIMKIEDSVADLAKLTEADLILFGGDAFHLNNPPSSIRDNVDRAVYEQSRVCETARLLGNHDREMRSMHSAHSSSHLRYFKTDHRVTTMDQAQDYHFPRIGLTITAVPAGHRILTVRSRASSFHICAFHDILTGSVHDNGMKEAKGVSPDLFDVPEFDLVLGGDNHVPQKLDLKNVPGWYIGAPCQHDWGDSGQDRGIVSITLEEEMRLEHRAKVVDFIRVPGGGPDFVKKTIEVTSLDTAENTYINDPTLKGNIVKIILKGDARLLSSATRMQTLEKAILTKSGARQLKIITEPTVTFKELIPALKDSKTPEDDWKAYIASGKVDLNGVDPDVLIAMGLELLRNTGRG